MARSSRSVVPAFAVAALSIAVAVGTGLAWLGKPLRLVHLLTIIGVSVSAGVSLAQAVWRARQLRHESRSESSVAASPE